MKSLPRHDILAASLLVLLCCLFYLTCFDVVPSYQVEGHVFGEETVKGMIGKQKKHWFIIHNQYLGGSLHNCQFHNFMSSDRQHYNADHLKHKRYFKFGYPTWSFLYQWQWDSTSPSLFGGRQTHWNRRPTKTGPFPIFVLIPIRDYDQVCIKAQSAHS